MDELLVSNLWCVMVDALWAIESAKCWARRWNHTRREIEKGRYKIVSWHGTGDLLL
jgi:hypothetical protein